MFETVGAQQGAAKSDGLKRAAQRGFIVRMEARLRYVRAQIMKLFGRGNMGWLHHLSMIALILQIGDGGKDTLDLENFLGNIGMGFEIFGISRPLVPFAPESGWR